MRSGKGRFQLGHALTNLGGRVETDALLVAEIQPHLDALALEFREAFQFVTRSGSQAINAARALPNRSLVISQPVGQLLPLYCTAAGKAILAFMPMQTRQQFLQTIETEKLTEHTITDASALEKELQQVGVRGYALESEEWEEGLSSVALPVHNGRGVVVGAIALAAPSSRLNDDLQQAAIKSIGDHISQIERSHFSESRTFASKAKPRGSYPHLKRVDNFVFVSGMSARRPDNSFVGAQLDEDGNVSTDIREQTRATLGSLQEMLHQVGATLQDVVEVQAYLIDMHDYSGFNEVYSEFFNSDGPARTTVAVHQLPHPHQALMIRTVAFIPQTNADLEA